MLYDWAFAQQGYGIFVIPERGDVIVLEYNEFLGRIGDGRVLGIDTVASQVLTRGYRVRVDSLRVYAMVISKEVHTDDLPRRAPGGVLATGAMAIALLAQMEDQIAPRRVVPDPQASILLRPATAPPAEVPPQEMLRPATAPPAEVTPQEMLRPSQLTPASVPLPNDGGKITKADE